MRPAVRFLPLLLIIATLHAADPTPATPPNIILMMCDDLGWGDTAYNGSTICKTPNLDAMAGAGLRMDRFYASSPVCSPSRGGCLTGRHPFRYGVFFANASHGNKASPSKYALPTAEITLAEALKARGYATGHFGKWHLGDWDGAKKSTPADHGFDEHFSTVRSVPLVDPDGYFHNGVAVPATETKGDDSQVIMDRAIPWITAQTKSGKPFLAVIWFHAPHGPTLALPEYKAMYAGRSNAEQDYFGSITACDVQIGRLRQELRALKIADNTMLWFTSDNGPEVNKPGSAGPFSGRKRNLLEGGVRVPGILEWPAKIPAGRVTDVACSNLDYYPTTLAMLGATMPNQLELDGIDLAPLIAGTMTTRPKPLAWETLKLGNNAGMPALAFMDGDLKWLTDPGASEGKLYDLGTDRAEMTDIAAQHPEAVKRLRDALAAWRAATQRDLARLGIKPPAPGSVTDTP